MCGCCLAEKSQNMAVSSERKAHRISQSFNRNIKKLSLAAHSTGCTMVTRSCYRKLHY
ncbi:hypothetical protein ANCCAN_22810 [Ancylostoma caninum]|uniref:Uncharacterized protein n=1 Tax=Ancylostoma caninum TaxID=29170 RepID=A0A368FGZ3_ANCCA|nr:hypothetical protein ANCCAN_22810 [Ancylostoma caninum]